MSLYNTLYRALFQVKDAVDGTGIYRTAARLHREQFLPVDELESLRRKRLADLLVHAREHSAYYREILSPLAIPPGGVFQLQDLSRIPLLTRDRIQDGADRILCSTSVDHYADASGGSTGQPVNFYHDQNYVRWSRAHQMLHLTWMGVRAGDRTAAFWGADRDLSDESIRTRILSHLARIHVLNSFSMTEAGIDAFLEELNRIRPRYVFGYASSLHHVARRITGDRPLRFQPVAVKSSAEMLYDFQREEIQTAFGAPVFNFYGSREVNNVAAECDAHAGLHVFASGRIVEIVDDRGNPLPPGETGNIAVTDLTNRAFPFIRYLNGDLGVTREDPCPCGRTYPRLEKIVGRTSDIIRIGDRRIHGEYFTHLFYGHSEVKSFQLVQETETGFVLWIVPRAGEVDVSFFRERMVEKLGQDIDLDIRLTPDIPPTSGGKHRFTVSRLQP